MGEKIFNDMFRSMLFIFSIFILCIYFLSVSVNNTYAVTARQNYYAESLDESTWQTNSSYQDKLTLTFTPDDNSTYMIMASCLFGNTGSAYGYAKLIRTTGTPRDLNVLLYRPKDYSDYISGAAIAYESFGSSPGSQTYKIQYTTSNTDLGAGKIKQAKIIAVKLDADDEYAEVDGLTTTTSTTYVDKTTLTFTPDTTGDYIILAYATGYGASVSYKFRIQLTIDGTVYSNYEIEPTYTPDRYPWAMVKRVSLSNESHTIKIQHSTSNAAAASGIANARIIALRADKFANNYFTESEDRVTTSTASYQTAATLTATPRAYDHILIGSAGIDASDETISSYADLLKGSTSFGEMLIEPKDVTNRGHPFFSIKKETLSASSTSWYIKYMTEDAAATAGIQNSRISLIELNQPSVTVSATGTQTAEVDPSDNNVYMGGAFEFVRNAGTATVTSIKINETGTIADEDISDLVLFYKQESSCSTSIPGDATQFNSTPGTFSSGSSTVTGTMNVGTSQICVYVRLDIGSSASPDETIEIRIANPSTDILVSAGDVTPATAVAISGTTTVNGEILAVDIVNESGTPIGTNFSLTDVYYSFIYQTTSGTLGTSAKKIYVTSGPSASWQLTIAPTNGATALWASEWVPVKEFDFNDSTSGAEDGGDDDLKGGQLTLGVASATLSPGEGCSNTGLSLGSNASFVEGSVNSVTLITASSGATDCNWSLTGIGLNQTIPKEQAVEYYFISLTLTITAT